MSEETENTREVVSWYYNRGQSKTSYTKIKVVNVYLDQNVETIHKLEKIPRYLLILNSEMQEREVSYLLSLQSILLSKEVQSFS